MKSTCRDNSPSIALPSPASKKAPYHLKGHLGAECDDFQEGIAEGIAGGGAGVVEGGVLVLRDY